MKHIKTIENLYLKALERYEHDGKFGQARLNGRMAYGWGSFSDLREKYSVIIIDIDGKPRLYLEHWGTETLAIDLHRKDILKFYGESVSDRDSMNTMLYLLNIPGRFRYFPSKDEFVYENETYYSKV